VLKTPTSLVLELKGVAGQGVGDDFGEDREQE
jgi:hypothetical protein